MSYLTDLEKNVQKHYDDVLKPLADRYEYPLPTSATEATGQPTVLMLGNHSSGKSSFINYLLDTEVQKTGLAPVDDGFTIITHGESEDEFDGLTIISHPQMPYSKLERFGPPFLSHFKMKTRPIDLLQSLTLIDSPGMIDSADESSGRNYDFPNVVRSFAERADLILFFFDPDKPGTTGETMKVFLHALQGLEHKLLIIMNKVDQFANIRDFARAYGALCWNLSKVIRTKDMPHIYNTYLPELVRESKHQEQQIALTDFDISRDEVVHEIERTPARRADNLVTALRDHSRRVAMHSRVCAEVAGRVRKLKRQAFMLTALLVVAAGGLGWLGWLQNWRWGIGLFLGFLAVAAGIYYLGRVLVGREKEHLENGLDGVFEDLYARDLALDDRADLRALWESVKPGVKTTLHAVGADKLPGPRGIRKHISRIDKTLNEEVPRMRRTLEMAKPRMEEEAGSATPSPSTA